MDDYLYHFYLDPKEKFGFLVGGKNDLNFERC